MDVFDSESDQQLDLAEREEVLGELEKTINNLAQQVEKAPPDSESISHSHPDSINGGLLHSNVNDALEGRLSPGERDVRRGSGNASPRISTISRLKRNTRLYLEPWVRVWLLISGVLYAYEGLYNINMPDSLPDGKFGVIFQFYEPFVQADYLLSSTNNFVVALSVVKLVEAFLGNAIAVTLHYLGVGPGACLWAYTVICVSLTRLGFSIIYEITSGMENTKHNNLHDVIAYYALPKAIMVVMCVSSLVRLAYLLIMRRKRVPRRSSSLHRSYQKEKDL